MSNYLRQRKKISLNDLPKYSDWVKRIFAFEKFDIKYKTEKEVLREFQDEKWNNILNRVRSLIKPTPAEIEQVFFEQAYSSSNDLQIPCFDAGEFYLAKGQLLEEAHIELYADTLTPYLNEASCLVELGAGYGAKIFNLAKRKEFSTLPLITGEYTANGRELIRLLAGAWSKSVIIGDCDFRKMKIENMSIPKNAIIFTSYAAHYIPELSMGFVDFLAKLKPRVVVHFEPCYEYYDMDTVHGMMCRRYMELNDYTKNLVSVIEASCARREITFQVKKNIIGSNPLMPISIIEWTPTDKY